MLLPFLLAGMAGRAGLPCVRENPVVPRDSSTFPTLPSTPVAAATYVLVYHDAAPTALSFSRFLLHRQLRSLVLTQTRKSPLYPSASS